MMIHEFHHNAKTIITCYFLIYVVLLRAHMCYAIFATLEHRSDVGVRQTTRRLTLISHLPPNKMHHTTYYYYHGDYSLIITDVFTYAVAPIDVIWARITRASVSPT